MIKDNLLLKSAKITVNGKVFKEYKENIPESIEVPLLSKNTAQQIEVTAIDAAGNTKVEKLIIFILQRICGSGSYIINI